MKVRSTIEPPSLSEKIKLEKKTKSVSKDKE